MILSREQLLAPGGDTLDKVDVTGGQVVVRGVTRAQALAIRAAGDQPADQEPHILAYGLVDPRLTLDEARAWCEVAIAGDVQRVVQAITDLSGMGDAAPKAATKSAAER